MKKLIEALGKVSDNERELLIENLAILVQKENKLSKLKLSSSNFKFIFTGTLRERQTAFKQDVEKYIKKYNESMLQDFYNYWSEPDHKLNKMKFEMEKTWEIGRRLITWYKRSFTRYNNTRQIPNPFTNG